MKEAKGKGKIHKVKEYFKRVLQINHLGKRGHQNLIGILDRK